MFKATADSEFLCACFDFTNPEFLAWYEERVKKIVRMGVSVIKQISLKQYLKMLYFTMA